MNGVECKGQTTGGTMLSICDCNVNTEIFLEICKTLVLVTKRCNILKTILNFYYYLQFFLTVELIRTNTVKFIFHCEIFLKNVYLFIINLNRFINHPIRINLEVPSLNQLISDINLAENIYISC